MKIFHFLLTGSLLSSAAASSQPAENEEIIIAQVLDEIIDKVGGKLQVDREEEQLSMESERIEDELVNSTDLSNSELSQCQQDTVNNDNVPIVSVQPVQPDSLSLKQTTSVNKKSQNLFLLVFTNFMVVLLSIVIAIFVSLLPNPKN